MSHGHFQARSAGVFVSLARLTSGLLFSLTLLAGCSAQSSPAPAPAADAVTQRRIELMLRSRLNNLPNGVEFSISNRRPSEFNGYDLITITLNSGEKTYPIEFLISKDDKTLARLDKMDLTQDPSSRISVAGRPVRGNPLAKVTIINFDDFQCPYCAQMHQQLFSDLMKTYGDRVKVIYKDYPLESIHKWAVHAAVDANCLAAQSQPAYWEFADSIHANQRSISANDKGDKRPLNDQLDRLDSIAAEIGRKNNLDSASLAACVKKQDDAAVRASMAEGEKLSIDSTPTLFINGERVNGAMPTAQFRLVLDRALRAEGQPVPPPPVAAQAPPQPPAKK